MLEENLDLRDVVSTQAPQALPVQDGAADGNKGDVHVMRSLTRDKVYFDISKIARQ